MPAGAWYSDRVTIGFEEITVSTTAIGLTAASYQPAFAAEITVETGAIRYRTDGTAPTAAVGHLLGDGDVLYIDSAADLASLSMIRDDSTDGDIKVTYFGNG